MVRARAGMIGSGNILAMRKAVMSCPQAKTMAIYRKVVICYSLNTLNMPQ